MAISKRKALGQLKMIQHVYPFMLQKSLTERDRKTLTLHLNRQWISPLTLSRTITRAQNTPSR